MDDVTVTGNFKSGRVLGKELPAQRHFIIRCGVAIKAADDDRVRPATDALSGFRRVVATLHDIGIASWSPTGGCGAEQDAAGRHRLALVCHSASNLRGPLITTAAAASQQNSADTDDQPEQEGVKCSHG